MARRANLPLHPNQGREWDGPAAAGRMLDDATSDGVLDRSRADEGFTYVTGSGENRGDYKSPFADMIGGVKQVVKRGVDAALARNGQVQGISEEERASGKRFLERQQARFAKEEAMTKPISQAPPNGIRFQADNVVRDGNRVLVASGNQSRNRDYWSGKPYRLVPSGMRLEAWLSNNVLLWMHNFYVPVGRANLFIETGQLWSDDMQFHRKKIPLATDNWIGDAIGEFDTGVIADLWMEKWLNAVSIHVMTTPEDEEAIQETDSEIVIPTSEVIEFSLVTVPGDREATRQIMQGWGVASPVIDAIVRPELWKPTPRRHGPIEIVSRQTEASMSTFKAVKPPSHLQAADADPVAEEAEEVEEVVEEADEVVEIEEVEEEFVLDMAEIVPLLAQSLVGDPDFVSALAEALQPAVQQALLPPQNAGPRQIRLVVSSGNGPAQPVAAAIPQATTPRVVESRPSSLAMSAPQAQPQTRPLTPKQKKAAMAATLIRR